MKPSLKAAFLSGLIFPGAGQLYLKHYIKGIIFILIAGISLFIILSAVFSVSLSIVEELQMSETKAINISAIAQKIMDVLNQQHIINAKIAAMLCWIISTLHGWMAGKKLNSSN